MYSAGAILECVALLELTLNQFLKSCSIAASYEPYAYSSNFRFGKYLKDQLGLNNYAIHQTFELLQIQKYWRCLPLGFYSCARHTWPDLSHHTVCRTVSHAK